MWRETVVNALETLGGKATLASIYDAVEQIRPGPLPASWRAIVRRELEYNSSDSESFQGRFDLFYSVNGVGKGVWGLRSLQTENSRTTAEKPPKIEDQVPVVEFSVNSDPLIDVAPPCELDASASTQKLSQMLPLVVSSANKLVDSFRYPSVQNSHLELRSLAEEYFDSINKPLNEVSFYQVWVLGVGLEKASNAADRSIEDRLKPALEDHQKSALDALVEIHGPFVLLSGEGQELHQSAFEYQLGDVNKEQLSSAVSMFSQAVNDTKDLFTDRVKAQVATADAELGGKNNTLRNFFTAETVTTNIIKAVGLLAITVGGAVGSGLIGNVAAETELGASLIKIGVSSVDEITQLGGIAANFILHNEELIRGYVASASQNLTWISDLLNWLKANRSPRNKSRNHSARSHSNEDNVESSKLKKIAEEIELGLSIDQAQFTLQISTDMEDFYHTRHQLRGDYPSPMFNGMINNFDEKNAFWISATSADAGDQILALSACRLDDVSPSLADWAANWMVDLYAKNKQKIIPAEHQIHHNSLTGQIHGQTAYIGETWWDHRLLRQTIGNNPFADVFTLYTLVQSFMRWNINHAWGLVAPETAIRGIPHRHGFGATEPGFLKWIEAPVDVPSEEFIIIATVASIEMRGQYLGYCD